jgi:hypothetical protein
MSENPLIVDEPRSGLLDGPVHMDAEHSFNGGGVFYDYASTIRDGADQNWVGLGIDVAADAMDTFAFCQDPLQGLLSAGIGWLIEHVSFLSEPLDYLAGDPDLVQEKAQTWANIKQALEKASQDYDQSAKALLQQYTGTAATAYSTSAANFAGGVASAAGHAENAKNAMVAAAAIVGTTRGLIRDAISGFVAAAIEKAAIALATSFLDFGASLAIFIGDEVYEGSILAEKSAARLTKLSEELSELASKAEKSASTASRAASSVEKDASKLSKQTSAALTDADRAAKKLTAVTRAASKDAEKAGAYSAKTAAATRANRSASDQLKAMLASTDSADAGLLRAAEHGAGPQSLVDTAAQAGHVESRLEKQIDKLAEQRRATLARQLHVPEESITGPLADRLREAAKEEATAAALHAPIEGGRQGVTEREIREEELEAAQEKREEPADGSLVGE